MKRFLSPKQAAQSMGVSESSLKRWCDRGTLAVQLTAGGHRRIPVTAVVKFVRENRRDLIRPELLGLPAKRETKSGNITGSITPFANALAAGETDNARQLLFGHFLNGVSVAKLCDELFAPALAMVGERWRDGDLEIYEEHQSVQFSYQLLGELHGMLPDVNPDAPVAIGGTPEHDVYGLPTRMIALALRESGWNSTSLGTSLPFSTLLAAVNKYRPRLVWLSVSVLRDPGSFGVKLGSFAAELDEDTTLIIGGRGAPVEDPAVHKGMTHRAQIQGLIAASKKLLSQTLQQQEN